MAQRSILILLGLMLLAGSDFDPAFGKGTPRQRSAVVADWPVYGFGNQGEAVRMIQYLLRARGYRLKMTGSFDRSTRSQVKSFQKKMKLTPDGIVGDRTWRALIVTVKRGNRGPTVIAVQSLLQGLGFDPITVDGVFGAQTQARVREYQIDRDLKADGVVGAETWRAFAREDQAEEDLPH